MPEQPIPTAISQTKLQIFLLFLKFGFLDWGGPMAQIAILKKELEEESITKERFSRALTVYQVLY